MLRAAAPCGIIAYRLTAIAFVFGMHALWGIPFMRCLVENRVAIGMAVSLLAGILVFSVVFRAVRRRLPVWFTLALWIVALLPVTLVTHTHVIPVSNGSSTSRNAGMPEAIR
jgi:hypothetical protein